MKKCSSTRLEVCWICYASAGLLISWYGCFVAAGLLNRAGLPYWQFECSVDSWFACSWIAGEVLKVDGSIAVELIRQLFCWFILIVVLITSYSWIGYASAGLLVC